MKFISKTFSAIFTVALIITISTILVMVSTKPIQAVTIKSLDPVSESTNSSEASQSTSLASASAKVEQELQDKIDQDLTETAGKQKSELAAYLDDNPIGNLTWHNPLQHIIRRAIANGLPANILVILLLFPVIASIIAFTRHVIGLKGYGIYIPAVLSVAFVSTGIPTGVAIFIIVILVANIAKALAKKLKLPSLPRTAMILWMVTIFILFLLIASAWLDISSILTINIFPLLIIMLLTENFMSTQLHTSQKEAISITFETLLIAVICAGIVSLDQVQRFVLIWPELTIVGVAIGNIILGKYTGLRILERVRFNSIIEEEEN